MRNLAHRTVLLCHSAKSNTCKSSSVQYFEKRYHCKEISVRWMGFNFLYCESESFCLSLCQKCWTTHLLGAWANVGKQNLHYICSWQSHFSRKEREELVPTVPFLTWSANFKPLFSLSLQLHELDVSLRLTIQQKHTEHSPINRSRHQW